MPLMESPEQKRSKGTFRTVVPTCHCEEEDWGIWISFFDAGITVGQCMAYGPKWKEILGDNLPAKILWGLFPKLGGSGKRFADQTLLLCLTLFAAGTSRGLRAKGRGGGSGQCQQIPQNGPIQGNCQAVRQQSWLKCCKWGKKHDAAWCPHQHAYFVELICDKLFLPGTRTLIEGS